MSARLASMFAASALVCLGGCSQHSEGDTPIAIKSQTANGTVAATVAASRDHRQLAAALADTQLAPVLDGKGVYTLLAPGDAAFGALGPKGEALADEDHRPLMIAVLRAHILPGQVTPQSISQALDRRQGPVEMRNMAGGTVRFAKGERGITVSNGTTTAMLGTVTQAASNGAVLPIDEVLLPAN